MTPTPSPRTADAELVRGLAAIAKTSTDMASRQLAESLLSMVEYEAEAAPAGGLREALRYYDERIDPERSTGEMSAREWRDAYFALARIALKELEDCRAEEHWHRGPSQSCSICVFAAPAGVDVLLGVGRLDRAMAKAGVHVDMARPGPTREVGCKSCQKGVAAIAAAYSEEGVG